MDGAAEAPGGVNSRAETLVTVVVAMVAQAEEGLAVAEAGMGPALGTRQQGRPDVHRAAASLRARLAVFKVARGHVQLELLCNKACIQASQWTSMWQFPSRELRLCDHWRTYAA